MRDNYTDPEPDQKSVAQIEAEEKDRQRKSAEHFQELELKKIKARDVVEFPKVNRLEPKWIIK